MGEQGDVFFCLPFFTHERKEKKKRKTIAESALLSICYQPLNTCVFLPFALFFRDIISVCNMSILLFFSEMKVFFSCLLQLVRKSTRQTVLKEEFVRVRAAAHVKFLPQGLTMG